MKLAILGTFLVALAVSGCQSMLQQPKDLGNGGEDKVFDVKRGIEQIRDTETGETFYVICESCAKSTLKTRYRPPLPAASTMAPAEPIPISPVPVMVLDMVPALISKPDTESAGQSASFQYMIPFAFGRSMLGPLGREAMEDVLAVAKEARCVHVRGHTDIIGNMPSNKRLAMARAAEIRAYLVKRGISADKLSISYCVDCFSDSNETTAGRAANRRAVVDMRLLLEAGDPTYPDRRDPCRPETTCDGAAQPICNRVEVKG